MASAEMILKIVMSPIESPKDFVKQCRIRLPDLQAPEFQKILDMKVFNISLYVSIIKIYLKLIKILSFILNF